MLEILVSPFRQHCPHFVYLLFFPVHFAFLFSSSQERLAVDKQARCRQHAQSGGEGFAGLDGSWDTAAGQEDRGQQCQFDSVGLTFRDAVTTEAVLPTCIRACFHSEQTDKCERTNTPTVNPAAILGTDPVRT